MPRTASQGPSLPYAARLTDGRTVRVAPVTADAPVPPGGDPALREARALIASLLTMNPAAAEAHGISLPVAWAAAVPGDPAGDLGLAWWTALPYHQFTAVAEVALAPGARRSGLGRVLLDLLALSAADRGVEWLQVRLPAGEERALAAALKTHRGRVTDRDGASCFVEIPLAGDPRRFHRSGVHWPVRRSAQPPLRPSAPQHVQSQGEIK
ncbi:MAG TPA: hypothetical protein VF862_08050 [Gemmatimonadales bacterium]